eukprot:TRINITY_DN230_c1_g1_i1.p1 TRINITY_DN230_c1_g1~~TRINITY_DN230_c1_g1_i1.p1  ORF type:complete len:297 (+),score=126.52 TRINITY_DN230_c1_g1_i1:131-1021(+)
MNDHISEINFDFIQPAKRIKSINLNSNIIVVTPGESISVEQGFLRGHNTIDNNGVLTSSVSGVVERVNKLVSVKPLKSRYQGEIGDVVVGRITELSSKRWKVDVNGRQDAILVLSSVNLPGGVLRRRTESDELNMRNLFVEGDLISAEVREFFGDGSMSLHTRNIKYGKLSNGQFISVPNTLIKRIKQTFYSFDWGVDVILANNGYIWISSPSQQDEENMNSSELLLTHHKEITFEVREKICRTRNAIMALANQFILIYPATIQETYNSSLENNINVKDMLQPKIIALITQKAATL